MCNVVTSLTTITLTTADAYASLIHLHHHLRQLQPVCSSTFFFRRVNPCAPKAAYGPIEEEIRDRLSEEEAHSRVFFNNKIY